MWQQYKQRIIKEAKILGVAVCAGVLLAVGVAAASFFYARAAQRGIAEGVLRFHVVAHSNAPQDQAIKDIVATRVLAAFAQDLAPLQSVAESRQAIYAQLPSLADYARAVLREHDVYMPVTAQLTRAFFPTVAYGELVFPPGMYYALQVTLGQAAGRNWWCLMFPPLCYLEMTGTDQTQQVLRYTVSAEGFRLISHQEQPPAVRVRFRVVEWWQSRTQ